MSSSTSRTLAVAIVACALGAVAARIWPPAHAAPQSQPPITATATSDGIIFRNGTQDSTFVIVGRADQPEQMAVARDIEETKLSTKGPQWFAIHRITHSYLFQNGKITECIPAGDCPDPPPCPKPGQCPPWTARVLKHKK